MAKALPSICRKTVPLIIGDLALFKEHLERFSDHLIPLRLPGEGREGEAEFLATGSLGKIVPGIVSGTCGRASIDYIIEALKLVFSGTARAIVTAPIGKGAIRAAGVQFPGHTELLAHYGGVTSHVMMMANPVLRVSLVTIHEPLKDVPSLISEQRVFDVIRTTHLSLTEHFSIDRPVLKVCGLNPHAGEGGILGTEEAGIDRAVLKAAGLGIAVKGPFPADTLFHVQDCDAFIAMYHDQGLIPVKTLDFRRTVNITLGLPFIRTSPGHGTGYDIAGQGTADPAGFIEAYRTAERMAMRKGTKYP